MKFSFAQHFSSRAKLKYFKRFSFQTVYFKNTNQEHYFKDTSTCYFNVPIILKGDSLPWDIGNIYLLRILKDREPWEVESINNQAKGLLIYLKFIEDNKLDYLEFPSNNRLKPTYKFRAKLNDLILNGLSTSYASNCMRSVINFYRFLQKSRIINSNLSSTPPFKEAQCHVRYESNFGLSRIKRLNTTDLSISSTKLTPPLDNIKDGGSLRPLSHYEQEILMNFIQSEDCNSELRLIIKIAISTGARLQTICTIRKYHIDFLMQELDNNQTNNFSSYSVELNTGRFRDIDTKNNSVQRLLFKKSLIHELYIYSTCEVAKSRALKSYYGDSRDNYLFLTKFGNSFYSSKKEILEQSENYDGQFILRKGISVEKSFRDLINKILKINPQMKSFRFHDLRATYGMNLVRYLSSSGIEGIQLLSIVRDRMGHSDFSVTQRYLKFDELNQAMESITDEYESRLFKLEYENRNE